MTKPPRWLAGVFLVDRSGALLLQLRDEHAPHHPNVWTTSGGHIEPGESPEATARRELFEEAGLHVSGDMELFWHGPASDGDDHVVLDMFCAATAAQQEDVVLGEGAAMVFVPSEDVLGLPIAPNMIDVIRRFLASPQYRRLAALGVAK